jgi:hypothetical protein
MPLLTLKVQIHATPEVEALLEEVMRSATKAYKHAFQVSAIKGSGDRATQSVVWPLHLGRCRAHEPKCEKSLLCAS